MMDAMTSFGGGHGFQYGAGGGNGGIREINYGGPRGGSAFGGAFGAFGGRGGRGQLQSVGQIVSQIGF